MLFAVSILALSGLTDVLDGILARNFNMISELGKILDPIADKLTIAAVIACLAITHTMLIPLLAVLVLKELLMLIGSLVLVRKGERPSEAKWFGKLSTVVLYIVIILIILSNTFNLFEVWLVYVLSVIACFCMMFSLYNYYTVFKKILFARAASKRDK